MSGEAGTEVVIRLHRDALSTPWGFRLQGGKDFKSPLRVQRVFVGSPADGELQRGDVILAIDNYDVTQLIHKEAEELIRKAGGSATLRVRRAGASSRQAASPSPAFVRQTSKSPSAAQQQQQYHRSRPFALSPFRPASVASSSAPRSVDSPMAHLRSPTWQVRSPTWQMNFGTDFSQHAGGRQAPQAQHRAHQQQDGSMLNRLNSSLTQALYEGSHGGNGTTTAADDYESKSVGQLRQQFATLPAGSGHSQAASNGQRKRWSKPQKPTFSPAPNHLTEIGWTPFTSKQQPASRWSHQNRQRPSSPPINSSAAAPQRHHQPPRPATAHEFDTPAWAGTLRSSGGPRPWELMQAESIAPASVARHRESRSEPPAAHEPATASTAAAGGSGGPAGGPVQPHQPKVQVMRYGPTGQQVYEQHEQYGDSDSARVMHLQYNSPLGLYSRENVEQALEGQTHDKAGYGTMQVSGGNPGKQFNPNNSAVLRLLAEEEGRKVGGRGHRVRPGGGASELKQSPMIYALDATYGNGAGADEQQQQQPQVAGMSDF